MSDDKNPSSNTSSNVMFGCSTSQSGELSRSERAVNGIFGFGQRDLSVISQLALQGEAPDAFSHCLVGDGDGGGILVLGQIMDPNMVYSPLVQSQPHYNLHLQSIAVDGKTLSIDPSVFESSHKLKGTIIDSGTTLGYLAEEAYNPFVEADGESAWCIGFQKVKGQGLTILGDIVLKDKSVVYDLGGQRIGWVDHDCKTPVNVSTKSSGRRTMSNASSLQNTLYQLTPFVIFASMLHLLTYEIGLQAAPALAVTGILLYIGSFSAGMGAVPWIIMSEEGPRTMVGIATFDSTIHFYNLKRALQQSLMLIVPDVQDVYTPLQTDVIVQLSEGSNNRLKEQIDVEP